MSDETILLVDDEEADRGLMHDILRRQGYQILEAMDYSSAWTVFKNHRDRTSLLVTDVSLPSANGCESSKALVQDKPDLHVLFLSAYVRWRPTHTITGLQSGQCPQLF